MSYVTELKKYGVLDKNMYSPCRQLYELRCLKCGKVFFSRFFNRHSRCRSCFSYNLEKLRVKCVSRDD